LYCAQRAVRTPEWLFIRTYHPGLYPFDEVMLFDMVGDPHQTRNLAETRQDVVRDLDHVMAQWVADALGQHGALPDPQQEVLEDGPFRYVSLERWMQWLADRGRTADLDELKRRLGLDKPPRPRHG
jgi:hypothetical protein